MKRTIAALILLTGGAAAAGWVAATPEPRAADSIAAHTPDIENGKRLTSPIFSAARASE